MLALPERSYIFINKLDIFDIKTKISNCRSVCGDQYTILLGYELDCVIRKLASHEFFFVGSFMDPDAPFENNEAVINTLLDGTPNFFEIINRTYSIFGKWIIIDASPEGISVYGDPCCTLSIKYVTDTVLIGDIASIIALLTEKKSIEEENKYGSSKSFYKGPYKHTNWQAGDATYWNDVKSLLPNHILHYSCDKQNVQANTSRYLYTQDCKTLPYEDVVEYCYRRTNQLLSGMYTALGNRSEYAITITGGKDSRILLAATSSIHEKHAHYFTTKTKDMADTHPDVAIPRLLSKQLKVNIDVFDIPYSQIMIENKIKEYFPEVRCEAYSRHCFSQFFSYPVKIVYGLIPEIFSCYYWYRLSRIDGKGLADIARCPGSKFAEMEYDNWIQHIDEETIKKGYKVMDLFYWEHRGGRWGGQYVNVTDLFQDSIHGFNCRELYDIWLKTPTVIRRGPRRKNLELIAKSFGEQFVNVPYEKPQTTIEKTRAIVERIIPLYYCGRRIEYRLKRIKARR